MMAMRCLSMVHSRSTTHMCGLEDGHDDLHVCHRCRLTWRTERPVKVACGTVQKGSMS